MKNVLKACKVAIADIVLLPLTFFAALILLYVRKIGFRRLKLSKMALLKVGVMPVMDHYYEPYFDKKKLRRPLTQDRYLPGIDWNIEEQVARLASLKYGAECAKLPDTAGADTAYHFDNGFFDSGDAEYWYNILRETKPKRIIEIGSGHSTKMAQLALKKNQEEDLSYRCHHTCIEPFEVPWLEKLDVTVMRQKVETVDSAIFKTLGKGDILFIDSSHIIRPQGDVLYEYLELLPTLNPGVIVHIHDIFSPKDYCADWILGEVRWWNEQYLLEAFLNCNHQWKVIGALNFLKHKYFEQLQVSCPRLTPDREPNSFYMVKVC